VHLGEETPVREGAARVIENIAATGAEEVIFYHDDCYALMATMAPDYGIEVPFRPVHIIEYLLDRVKKNPAAVRRLGIRAAYQQPCASRYTREYDRLFALCCGSPMMPRDREKAMRIKERNIHDAVNSGAQAMAYLCPLCFLNLRKVAAASGLENYHIIELVKKAI
jgi:Fe-S oxidoreductase